MKVLSMKTFFLLPFIALASAQAILAQTETFDIATFIPPAGWTRTASDGSLVFEHRRKTVENGLRLSWPSFANSPKSLEAILPSVPFRTRRVEELSPEEIGRIADALRSAKG